MLVLFIWQFGSFRKLLLIVGIIPFAMIGVGALIIAREPLGFMANFGLLSLAGIIVNNAVLLLERIEVELAAGKSRREAVVAAAVARLRPIVMTKLTCIAGRFRCCCSPARWDRHGRHHHGRAAARHVDHARHGAGAV